MCVCVCVCERERERERERECWCVYFDRGGGTANCSVIMLRVSLFSLVVLHGILNLSILSMLHLNNNN